jgi:hypothetical protein
VRGHKKNSSAAKKMLRQESLALWLAFKGESHRLFNHY